MVDGKIVLFARPTTLVGPQSGTAEFATQPLDVSQQGGAQFQVWRGPSTGKVLVYLEESLDGEKWVLGPSTPTGFELTANDTKFFSYSFRLRWFRLRVELVYTSTAWPKVTLWAEGFLRGGGSGAWPVPGVAPGTSPLAAGLKAAGAFAGPVTAPGSIAGAVPGSGDDMQTGGILRDPYFSDIIRQMEIEALRRAGNAGK